VLYIALRRVLELVLLGSRSDKSNELKIVVLRHQLHVLRRQVSRAQPKPSDRFGTPDLRGLSPAPGDQPRAASAGREAERPAGEYKQPVLKANQVGGLSPSLPRCQIGPGLSVATGKLNDAALAARAAALGVDAITTDRPAALHRELAAMSLAGLNGDRGTGPEGCGQPVRSTARIRGWPSISG